VLSAVDFDEYARIDAGEVGDIRRNRMLPAEAPASEPLVAKATPQPTLGVCHVPA